LTSAIILAIPSLAALIFLLAISAYSPKFAIAVAAAKASSSIFYIRKSK
jgi:hypothetical protein